MTDDVTRIGQVVVTAYQPLRKPRIRALIGGAVFYPTSGQIVLSNYFNADTFTLDFPLWHDAEHDLDWWFNTSPLNIEIEMGREVDGQVSWTQVLKGQVDSVDASWGGGYVSINGRDQTALFIDNRVSKTFTNKTASEIVSELASGRGLTAEVDATSRNSGRFYDKDHTSTHLDSSSNTMTEWDLIVHLAQVEGFDAWVDGDVLHFKALAEDPDPIVLDVSAPVLENGIARYSDHDFMDLRVNRNLVLSKEVQVIVRSYHSGTGRRVEAKAGKKPKNADDSSITQYVFHVPNLNQSEAQARADSWLENLTKHEYTVEYTAVGQHRIGARRRIELVNSNSVLDQKYRIDDISLDISYDSGFTMTVRAKNTPLATQAEDQ